MNNQTELPKAMETYEEKLAKRRALHRSLNVRRVCDVLCDNAAKRTDATFSDLADALLEVLNRLTDKHPY